MVKVSEKKSMLGNIRVDALTSIVVDCLAGKDIEDMDKYDFILFCSLSNRSFHQRVSSPTTSLPTYEVSSPTPLNYRRYRATFALTGISITITYYSSFFYPQRSQTNRFTQNLSPYNLFLILSSTAEQNEKVFWTLGPKVTGI